MTKQHLGDVVVDVADSAGEGRYVIRFGIGTVTAADRDRCLTVRRWQGSFTVNL